MPAHGFLSCIPYFTQVYTLHTCGKDKKLCVRGDSRCVQIPIWGTLSSTYVWHWRAVEQTSCLLVQCLCWSSVCHYGVGSCAQHWHIRVLYTTTTVEQASCLLFQSLWCWILHVALMQSCVVYEDHYLTVCCHCTVILVHSLVRFCVYRLASVVCLLLSGRCALTLVGRLKKKTKDLGVAVSETSSYFTRTPYFLKTSLTTFFFTPLAVHMQHFSCVAVTNQD